MSVRSGLWKSVLFLAGILSTQGCALLRENESTDSTTDFQPKLLVASPVPNAIPVPNEISDSSVTEIKFAPSPIVPAGGSDAIEADPAGIDAVFDSRRSILPADAPPPKTIAPVWGIVGMRGYVRGEQVAPNGVEFIPIFSLDLNFNFWLWERQSIYSYSDLTFWGQKAAPGITNSKQGALDFSKREFDFTTGLAWNYTGRWEARAFAYSFNNLNRGNSSTSPAGYNDGIGLESRYYLSEVYDSLGTTAFDKARATFVSVGYFPTKDMVDLTGNTFKPGPFAHAYLTQDLWTENCYLYGDLMLIGLPTFEPKLLNIDAGVAFRPFCSTKRWEFRIGATNIFDFQVKETETNIYGSIRYIY